jgi:fatty-acyl-CoA synthase
MTAPVSDLWWPIYREPADIAAIEKVPLTERGLPSSTYELLTRAAQLWPGRPAMSVLPDAAGWHRPATVSYAQLAERVNAVANTLTACDIGRRDAIAVIAPNCAELPVALLAAEAVGIAAPINPNLSGEHIGRLLSASGAHVVLAAGPDLDPGVWATARQVAAAADVHTLLALHSTEVTDPAVLEPLDGIRVGYLADFATRQRTDALTSAPPDGSDLAAYVHTGGTTGAPKLAAHTHANQIADAWMVAAGQNLADDAVIFAALPLFHVNALIVTMLAPLFTGQHVLWSGPLGYRDPALFGVFWKLVERYRVAAMSAVPTVYAGLARVPVDADISSLQLPIVGAAPLPPAVREAFESHTGIALCEGYGLTEATCATARSYPDHPRLGTVGQRMPYQQVKAVRVDPGTGQRNDLAPGLTGVLMINGPAVFPGYLVRGPDGPTVDAAGKVIDGWLDTGDLGSVDAEGFIRLTGRAKDLIIRGGHNIDPAVIEAALLSHPRVAGAAAVGSPDPHAGEVPVAYVTLTPGDPLEPADLARWAGARVPERAAAPRDVIVLDALPTTDVGKPFKAELRRDATHRAVLAALAALPERNSSHPWVTTRLVDGTVVVDIDIDGDSEHLRQILDRYPITWRLPSAQG